MPSRLAVSFGILAGFLGLVGQALAQAAGEQELHSFRDWTTACPKQAGGGACTANAFVLNSSDPAHFDYRLTASPANGAAGYSLSFASPALGLDSGKGIALRVDDNKTLSLAPGTGFAPDQVVADSIVIEDSTSLRGLIQQMQKGREVRVGFTDRVGRPQTVGFSLMGVTAALKQIAGTGTTAGNAGGATVQKAILSVPAAEDWSVRLPEFLSAMRSCLSATPGGPSTVTRAWPMEKGMVGVRTRGPDGQRWDCFVASGTPAVATFDAVPGDDKGLPGEAAPLFTPPGQSPPDDGCSRSERVRDENGDFVGWLTYRSC